MEERKAVRYGQVCLIPEVRSDAYILNDGTACLSERGLAALLGMEHSTLRSVVGNWPPKWLEPFVDKDLSVVGNLVGVTAANSPHKGRKIVVYTVKMVENLIRGYALALAHDALRENQKHIGKKGVILQSVLVRTALEAAIEESCGMVPQVQKLAQRNFQECAKLIHEMGFRFSVENDVATKKDILQFLKVPAGTLNSFLRKNSHEIRPIKLPATVIGSLGSSARYLHGYSLEDTVKIIFRMDTEVGVELKRRMFGEVAGYIPMKPKSEIAWRAILAKIFAGFGLQYTYRIGNYWVDYFVPALGLVLECNGYDCHSSYDPEKEAQRDEEITKQYCLIRFHNQISVETLFNAILKAKPKTLVRLYDLEEVGQSYSISEV